MEDFNPHSRKGSDFYLEAIGAGQSGISIHTPAKGVTFDEMFYDEMIPEFQSTLPQRE